MRIRNKLFCPFALLLIPLLGGCSESRRVEATVGSVRLCDDNGAWHMAPFARYDDGTQVALRYEPTKILQKLPWGMEHRVELVVTKHRSVLALGGTSVRVGRVLSSKSRAGESLILPVNNGCIAVDHRSFLDGQTFTCRSPEVCAALDRQVERLPQQPWEMEIRLGAQPGAPFVVERVRPPEARACSYFPCDAATSSPTSNP